MNPACPEARDSTTYQLRLAIPQPDGSRILVASGTPEFSKDQPRRVTLSPISVAIFGKPRPATGPGTGEPAAIHTVHADRAVMEFDKPVSSPHDLGLLLGGFRANDPAGALLTWRGWALGDRPTRLFERLPLAPLPAFGSDGLFFVQEAFEEPFHEIDGHTGWYGGAQWDYLDRSRLRFLHYDNRGDPRVARHGQWAWSPAGCEACQP